MPVTDLVILPLGCVVCGVLAASPVILRVLPFLSGLVEALARRRAPVGLATALAGVVALIFPAHGPSMLGSFVPALLAIGVGLGLSVDVLAGTNLARRFRKPLVVLGNALIYVRVPLGLIAVAAGLFHAVSPASPFF